MGGIVNFLLPPSFSSSIAVTRALRISSSGGGGIVALDIHILPLMPGSLRVRACCLEIGTET